MRAPLFAAGTRRQCAPPFPALCAALQAQPEPLLRAACAPAASDAARRLRERTPVWQPCRPRTASRTTMTVRTHVVSAASLQPAARAGAVADAGLLSCVFRRRRLCVLWREPSDEAAPPGDDAPLGAGIRLTQAHGDIRTRPGVAPERNPSVGLTLAPRAVCAAPSPRIRERAGTVPRGRLRRFLGAHHARDSTGKCRPGSQTFANAKARVPAFCVALGAPGRHAQLQLGRGLPHL